MTVIIALLGLWSVNTTTCLKDGAIYKSSGWSLDFNWAGEFISKSQLSRCSSVSKHSFSFDENRVFISKGQMRKVCGTEERVVEVSAFELPYLLTPNLVVRAHNSFCKGPADYEFVKSP